MNCRNDAEREAALAVDLDIRLPGGRPRPLLEEEAHRLAAACAARVDAALLGQLSTDVVARDMDQVRAALGEQRISFLGGSYGTLLGATYATLFPHRVLYMVLDAPLHPTLWLQDPLGAVVEQTVAAEAVLNRYFATCVAEGAACPFGAGKPAEAFDALVTSLEHRPLQIPAVAGAPAAQVDGVALLGAARTAVFEPKLWPMLTAVLLAAQRGDGLPAHQLGGALVREPDGSPNGLAESNAAVNCLDRQFPTDRAAYDDNAQRLQALAPRFGNTAGYVYLACAVWPVQNPDRYLGPLTGAGAPPVLVIGGREDSQTPYPWAEAMARTLESSVLLTRDGPGHGSWGSGPCVDGAIERYLTTGETPPTGSVCPREPAPTASPTVLGR